MRRTPLPLVESSRPEEDSDTAAEVESKADEVSAAAEPSGWIAQSEQDNSDSAVWETPNKSGGNENVKWWKRKLRLLYQ